MREVSARGLAARWSTRCCPAKPRCIILTCAHSARRARTMIWWCSAPAAACFRHCSAKLLEIVSHAKAAIGIFGTHSRELIARPAFDRLIDRLDTWFARYEDDVLMYGRGRRNVVHIGDWLIDQFPLARAINDEPLMISDDVGQEFALDRAIRTIQQHKQVYSTLPTALLCALTSAELAAYAEPQRSVVGGQFRSMLIDIFGRAF